MRTLLTPLALAALSAALSFAPPTATPVLAQEDSGVAVYSGEAINSPITTIEEKDGSYLVRTRFNHQAGAKETTIVRELVENLLRCRKVNLKGVAISPPFADRDTVLVTVTPKTRETEDGLLVSLPPVVYKGIELRAREDKSLIFILTTNRIVGRKGVTGVTLREEAKALLVPYATQLRHFLPGALALDFRDSLVQLRDVHPDGDWIEFVVGPKESAAAAALSTRTLGTPEAERFSRLSEVLNAE